MRTPPAGPEPVAPSRDDPAVEGLTGLLGGPWGAHAAPRRWWTPVRVLLVLGGTAWVLGMLTKAPCAAGGWQRTSADFGRGCWNDWGWAGLGQPAGANAADLPPAPALLAAAARAFSHAFDDPVQRVVLAAAVTALVLGLGMALATVALATHTPSRPWDAGVFALAPMAALGWLTSWHTVAALALALALWAWQRGRPVVAGLAVGVAAATVLSAAALLLAWVVTTRAGDPSRRRAARDAGAAAAFTWLVLTLPGFVLGDGHGTWWVRPVDSGSLWLVAQQALDTEISQRWTVLVGVVLWAGWAVLVTTLARRSGTASAALVALLLVAGGLVLAPALTPGAGLVLLPLAALAVPRWAVIGVWQALELAHLVVTGWYYAGWMAPGDGGDVPLVWVLIVLRVAGIAWLCGHALVRLRSGDVDPVEGGRGVADPDLDLLADGRHARA